jgi:hypothetical protein
MQFLPQHFHPFQKVSLTKLIGICQLPGATFQGIIVRLVGFNFLVQFDDYLGVREYKSIIQLDLFDLKVAHCLQGVDDDFTLVGFRPQLFVIDYQTINVPTHEEHDSEQDGDDNAETDFGLSSLHFDSPVSVVVH